MRGVDQQIIVGVGADADFLPVEFLQIHHQLIPHLKETNQTKTKQKKPQQNGVLMANGMNLATHRVEGSFLEPLHGGCSDGRLKLAQENRIVSSSFFFLFFLSLFLRPWRPSDVAVFNENCTNYPRSSSAPLGFVCSWNWRSASHYRYYPSIHRSIDPSLWIWIYIFIYCMYDVIVYRSGKWNMLKCLSWWRHAHLLGGKMKDGALGK